MKELTLPTVKRSSLLLYWQKRKEITYLDSNTREHSIHESLPRERDKLTIRTKGWIFPNYGFSCSGIYASISVNFWFNPSGLKKRPRKFFYNYLYSAICWILTYQTSCCFAFRNSPSLSVSLWAFPIYIWAYKILLGGSWSWATARLTFRHPWGIRLFGVLVHVF